MILLSTLATAVLLWWLVKAALRADPARLSRLVKQAGGTAALAVAGLLLLRGRIDMAVLIGGAGIALLGSAGAGWALPTSLFARRQPGISRSRSASIEIEWSRATNRITGTVLAGPFAGRALDELSPAELSRLAELCARADRDGSALLQAYLDRRFPGRREHAQGDPNARPRSDLENGAMTQEEAYEVLGLQPGAAEAAVRQAHRQLMKKLHPDGGGSTYLAARVNQAKDVLLSRHR